MNPWNWCDLFRLDNNDNTIDYTYDKNGNIKTITYEKGKANEKITEYFYDDLNQLLREDNQVLNKIIKYSYDNGGNILSKEEYAYTTDETLTDPSKVSAYTYDSVWKDKLTSYDGKAITSDEIGNTTGYDGWTLTWDRGRELATMSGNGKSLSFTYNENGIRTTKTVDGATTKYYLIGDAVASETNGTDNIYYTYGTENNLISMNLNGEEYYYVRNAQNDIIGLIDSIGTEVVRYTYDTWGKLISITDKDGNDVTHDTTHIGYKNPYRYRGYRYDNETGLYYLQSRYYNPDWGRFINADDYLGQQGELLSHNLFAYCLNNPVNMADDTGYLPFFVVTGIAGALIGGVIGYAATGSWKGTLAGAAIGGTIGLTGGAAAGKLLAGSALAKTGAVIAGGKALLGMAALSVPTFVKNTNTFISWAQQAFEKTHKVLNLAQVKQLFNMANRYGVKITADLAGHAKTTWDMAHIHLGNARVHVAVAKEAIKWIVERLK